MKDGYYFVLKLTENEHDAVEGLIKEFCDNNFMTMKYYRKIKDGHRPMIRECKVLGNRKRMATFKKFLEEQYIEGLIINNYWEEEKRRMKEILAKYTPEEIKAFEEKWGIEIKRKK